MSFDCESNGVILHYDENTYMEVMESIHGTPLKKLINGEIERCEVRRVNLYFVGNMSHRLQAILLGSHDILEGGSLATSL